MKNIIYFLFTKSIGAYLNLLSYVYPKKAVQLAHSLYTEPRKGKLTKNNLPKVLQDAESEIIVNKDDTIQTYIWKGNKTVILLVHGWESNSSRWENLLPYLQKSGCTIVAVDGPGQGLSSGKEFSVIKFAEFIDVVAHKHQPQYLIGHSLGGKSCLYYQYKYQNPNIQKMVILGSPSDFRIIFNNFIQLLSLNDKIASHLSTKYTSALNHNLDDFSGKYFAATIDTAGFLAHDLDDTVVLFDEGKKISKSWKNSLFVETSGLGHSLHDADLYKKVAQFLFN